VAAEAAATTTAASERASTLSRRSRAGRLGDFIHDDPAGSSS